MSAGCRAGMTDSGAISGVEAPLPGPMNAMSPIDTGPRPRPAKTRIRLPRQVRHDCGVAREWFGGMAPSACPLVGALSLDHTMVHFGRLVCGGVRRTCTADTASGRVASKWCSGLVAAAVSKARVFRCPN